MTKFDLVGALRTYCISKGWHFLYGSAFYQNIEADEAYLNGELILGADFNARPVYGRGMGITEIQYSGILLLGRKFDNDGTDAVVDDPGTPEDETVLATNDATPASLDESMIQKYDRRLLELMTYLSGAIQALSCANELNVTNCEIKMDINKFDTNIDFVAANITFVQ
jgi:hypothetical protein